MHCSALRYDDDGDGDDDDDDVVVKAGHHEALRLNVNLTSSIQPPSDKRERPCATTEICSIAAPAKHVYVYVSYVVYSI